MREQLPVQNSADAALLCALPPAFLLRKPAFRFPVSIQSSGAHLQQPAIKVKVTVMRSVIYDVSTGGGRTNRWYLWITGMYLQMNQN